MGKKRRFQHLINLSDVEKIFGHHSKGKIMDKIILNIKMVIYNQNFEKRNTL